MEVTPNNTLGGRIVLSLVGVLLAIHIQAERKAFKRWLLYLWSRLCQAVSQHPGPETEDADSKAREDQLFEMLQQVRLENLKMAWDTVLLLYWPTWASWMLYLVFDSASSFAADTLEILGFHCGCYGLLLFIKFGPITDLRPSIVTVAQHLFYSIWFFRVIAMRNAATFFLFGHTRLAVRLLIGVGTLDHRRAGIWGIAFAIANMYQHVSLTSQLEGLQMPLFFFAINEVGTLALIWFVVYTVEIFIRQRLCAQLEARAFASEASGVRSLLSVLCDAEVQLGPDLRIAESHERLVRLLTMSCGSQTGSSLAGVEFSQYLAEGDRPRFQTFLDSTVLLAKAQCQGVSSDTGAQSGEGLPSPPPASLHVHMRDSSGIFFSAEIFHVYLHDLKGQPAHLIGICEGGGRRTPTPQDWAQFPYIHPSTSPKIRSSASESSSSTSSSSSFKRAAEGLSCLNSIEISFDPFADQMPIDTCSFHFFADEEKPEQLHAMPKLMQYLVMEHQSRFSDWVIQEVNRVCHSPCTRTSKMQDLLFLLPASRTSAQQLKANAELVVSEAPPGDEEACAGSEGENDSEQSSTDAFNATIILRDISPARSKKVQKLPRISES